MTESDRHEQAEEGTRRNTGASVRFLLLLNFAISAGVSMVLLDDLTRWLTPFPGSRRG